MAQDMHINYCEIVTSPPPLVVWVPGNWYPFFSAIIEQLSLLKLKLTMPAGEYV